MTAFLVLGCIALALLLLSLVRVGGEATYSAEGLLVKLKIGFLRFTVYPMKPVAKPPKQKKKKRKMEQPEEPKKGGGLAQVKQYLPLLGEAVGRFRRKLRIDRIRLDLIWGAADPADCALGYGYANAALGVLWPILENNFKIKSRSIHTGVDFSLQSPTIYVDAAFTLTIGQCAALGIPLLWKALRIGSNHKSVKKKEAQKL